MLRSLKTTTYPKDGETEPFVSQIVHYDRNGNEIARYEYQGPNQFESRTETRFDENNQVMETTTWADEHEIAERRSYVRNPKGQVEQVNIEFSDGSVSVQTIEYDERNHTENRTERNEDDELESREFLTFSEDGQLLSREVYDFNDKLREVFEFEYNEAGEVAVRRHLDERRKLILETVFTYSEGGQLVLRVSRNRRGDLSDFLKIEYNELLQAVKQSFSNRYIFTFEYDERGNQIAEEQYTGDSLDNRITSEYDANNRIVFEEQAGFIRKFEYEEY